MMSGGAESFSGVLKKKERAKTFYPSVENLYFFFKHTLRSTSKNLPHVSFFIHFYKLSLSLKIFQYTSGLTLSKNLFVTFYFFHHYFVILRLRDSSYFPGVQLRVQGPQYTSWFLNFFISNVKHRRTEDTVHEASPILPSPELLITR